MAAPRARQRFCGQVRELHVLNRYTNGSLLWSLFTLLKEEKK